MALTPAAHGFLMDLVYIIPCIVAVFAAMFGLLYLIMDAYHNGPWWVRVLLFVPVLVINILSVLIIRQAIISFFRNSR